MLELMLSRLYQFNVTHNQHTQQQLTGEITLNNSLYQFQHVLKVISDSSAFNLVCFNHQYIIERILIDVCS
jgi:hypothetical protein